MLFLSFCFRSQRTAQARPPNLHALPNPRIGEGVPHESLPHKAEANRNGPRVVFNGKTDKNMVPKPEDETKEGDTGDQGIK